MATLKYRKSRKNKKQLKKKKRTYKKRRTIRRKKGGTDDEELYYGPIEVKNFDPRNLDHLTTKFMTSKSIVEQLNLLQQIVADDKKSCGLLWNPICHSEKVDDYCDILVKVNKILENKSLDKISRSEFNGYKNEIEKKVKKHMQKAGIEVSECLMSKYEEDPKLSKDEV